jgi:hypothetical protein
MAFSSTNIILSYYNNILKYKYLYFFSLGITLFLTIGIYIKQPQRYTSSILMHSKLFPYETITNSLEPVLAASKSSEYESITKLINCPIDIVNKVNKINVNKVTGMNDKVAFNGSLYTIDIITNDNEYKNIEFFSTQLIKFINNNKFIKTQLEIEKESKKFRLDNLDSTLSNINETESGIRRKINSMEKIDFEIGKLYESKVQVINFRQEAFETNARLNKGIDILSISELYPIKKISMVFIFLALFIILNLFFVFYVNLKEQFIAEELT